MNQFSVLNVKESVIRIEFLIFRDCCRRVIVVSAASRKDFFANFVAAARSAGIFAFFQRRYDRNVIPDKIVAIPLKSELPKDFGQRIRPIVFGRDFFRPGRKIRKGSVHANASSCHDNGAKSSTTLGGTRKRTMVPHGRLSLTSMTRSVCKSHGMPPMSNEKTEITTVEFMLVDVNVASVLVLLVAVVLFSMIVSLKWLGFATIVESIETTLADTESAIDINVMQRAK
jgi:hypothetical protein